MARAGAGLRGKFVALQEPFALPTTAAASSTRIITVTYSSGSSLCLEAGGVIAMVAVAVSPRPWVVINRIRNRNGETSAIRLSRDNNDYAVRGD